MEALNNNFYDLNAQRDYPLDDGASGLDDAGRALPTDLLVDCQLRWPRQYGRYLFVSSLAATPTSVSAVFCASHVAAVPRLGDRLLLRPTGVCASNWNHTGAIAKITESVYPPRGVGDGLFFGSVGQPGGEARLLGLNFAAPELRNLALDRVILWSYMRVANYAGQPLQIMYVADSEINLSVTAEVSGQLGLQDRWVRVELLRPPVITDLATSGVLYYRPPGSAYDIYLDTVVLEAVPLSAVTSTPVAAVSMPQPFNPRRQVAVTPLVDGAGGWVVFGDGVDEPYSGKFSRVQQSQLLPRCAYGYAPAAVPTLGKEFAAQPLTGLVTLRAGSDIKISRQVLPLDGAERAAIVAELNNDINRNIYQLYAGPCGARPESENCARRALEYINTVAPDCQGNIEIEFRHVLAIPDSRGSGGMILEHARGLAEICTREDRLPDRDGRLPNEFDDLCGPPCYDSSWELVQSCSSSVSSGTLSETLSSQSLDSRLSSSSLEVTTQFVLRPTFLAEYTGDVSGAAPNVLHMAEDILAPDWLGGFVVADGRRVTLPFDNAVRFAFRLGDWSGPDDIRQLQGTRPSSFVVWLLAKARGYSDPDGPLGGGPGQPGGNPVDGGWCTRECNWCIVSPIPISPGKQLTSGNHCALQLPTGASFRYQNCCDVRLISGQTGSTAAERQLEEARNRQNVPPGLPGAVGGLGRQNQGIVPEWVNAYTDFWFVDTHGQLVDTGAFASFWTRDYRWTRLEFFGPFRTIGELPVGRQDLLPSVRIQKRPLTQIDIEAAYLEVRYDQEVYEEQFGSLDADWFLAVDEHTTTLPLVVEHVTPAPYTTTRVTTGLHPVERCWPVNVLRRWRVDCYATAPPDEPSSSYSASSLEILPAYGLPYTDYFEQQPLDARWTVAAGSFVRAHVATPYDGGDSSSSLHCSLSSVSVAPSSSSSWVAGCAYRDTPLYRALESSDPSGRCLLLWDDAGYSDTLDKLLTVNFQIAGYRQPHRNAGVVLNYRWDAELRRPTFFFVRVDHQQGGVQVQHYNGATLTPIGSLAAGLPLKTDHWYQLRALATPLDAVQVQLSIELLDLESATPVLSLLLATSHYGPPDGKFGVGTDKAYARFSMFDLREV